MFEDHITNLGDIYDALQTRDNGDCREEVGRLICTLSSVLGRLNVLARRVRRLETGSLYDDTHTH